MQFIPVRGRMSNPDNLQTIYVSNLPWNVNADILKETFAKNGEITDCFVAYRGSSRAPSIPTDPIVLPPRAHAQAKPSSCRSLVVC